MKMAETFQLSNSNINRISLDTVELKASEPKNMALNSIKLPYKLKYDIPRAIDNSVDQISYEVVKKYAF